MLFFERGRPAARRVKSKPYAGSRLQPALRRAILCRRCSAGRGLAAILAITTGCRNVTGRTRVPGDSLPSRGPGPASISQASAPAFPSPLIAVPLASTGSSARHQRRVEPHASPPGGGGVGGGGWGGGGSVMARVCPRISSPPDFDGETQLHAWPFYAPHRNALRSISAARSISRRVGRSRPASHRRRIPADSAAIADRPTLSEQCRPQLAQIVHRPGFTAASPFDALQ